MKYRGLFGRHDD